MTSTLQVPEARFSTIEEAYEVLGPVMRAIASAVGRHCEVVLHDLTSGNLGSSIYAIENGHVSGRVVGGPSTNLGLEVMKDESADHNAFGYRGLTDDGRELHSSSLYYRDHSGKVIAAFCVNYDLTPLQMASEALGNLMPHATPGDDGPKEIVSPDIGSILEKMIGDAVAAVGKTAATMDKTERIEVLRLLEDRGAFAIKRAADIVAKRLGVSRVTIYGYLDEVRNGA